MTLDAHLHRSPLNAVLLLALLSGLFFHPAPALALGNGEAALPDFAEFSEMVQTREAGVLRGVYVSDVLALPVIQQPSGNIGYVSPRDGEITQFSTAADFGNVGLLAHNTLSGRFFAQLAIGQEVRLVYGDGKVAYFVITQILRFEALEPTSQYSSFRDLTNDEMLTSSQLFNKVYGGKPHVTFQTCIAGDTGPSWGRLFVIAVPKAQNVSGNRFPHKMGR